MSAPQARFACDPSPTAPRTARRLVAQQLAVWEVDPGHVPDALVVVTELVSNAVDHAGVEHVLHLDLTVDGTRLRIGLADGSSVRPVVRQLDPTAVRGRGMQIVAAIADGWGAEDHDGGKRVWVDLGLRSGPDPASEPDGPRCR